MTNWKPSLVRLPHVAFSFEHSLLSFIHQYSAGSLMFSVCVKWAEREVKDFIVYLTFIICNICLPRTKVTSNTDIHSQSTLRRNLFPHGRAWAVNEYWAKLWAKWKAIFGLPDCLNVLHTGQHLSARKKCSTHKCRIMLYSCMQAFSLK